MAKRRPSPTPRNAPTRIRAPLSRARILEAALGIADRRGLEAVSMRSIGEALSVEAMSLYRYVRNKDDLLDGLVDIVLGEMRTPLPEVGLREGLKARAQSMRAALLRHPWSAMLIESRTTPSEARIGFHEASLRLLRTNGFDVELAYHAILSLDSYVYGFVAQEVWWPFAPEERPELIAELAPSIDPARYPCLVEVMGFVESRSATPRAPGGSSRAGYDADFAFGLGLLLDGLEGALRTQGRANP